MNENILRALMQFAALVAQINKSHFRKNAHSLIKNFLEQKHGKKNIRDFLKKYLELYNDYIINYDSDTYFTKPNYLQTQTQIICSSLITELTISERLILLFSLLELIEADNIITQEEADFTRYVANEFKIDVFEYEKAYDLIINKQPVNIQSSDYCVIYDSNIEISEELEGTWISKYKPEKNQKHLSIHKEGLDGKIFIVKFKQTDLIVLKYQGRDNIYLSGEQVLPDKYYIFDSYNQLIFTDTSINFHEISGIFKNESPVPKTQLTGSQISISQDNKKSTNTFCFSEESGNIICLLGQNKCTSKILRTIAGRSQKPMGKIFLNGYNIYSNFHKIQKYIGFVPDRPIYSKNITIYENLYYTTQLTFPIFNDKQVKEHLSSIISECKLNGIENNMPGEELLNFSPALQNILIHIALELIRKPTILYIQSPFDYLNAPDCEIILQIIKTFAQNGNLAFITSFQLNTAILKLTDKLWIFDEGNYLIYSGNTTDAFHYFKTQEPNYTYHEEQCANCGTLNPELLFQIIQHKAVDDRGKLTVQRKISPAEWSRRYKNTVEKNIEPKVTQTILPFHQNTLPNIDTQFLLYFKVNAIHQLHRMYDNLKEFIYLILIATIIPLLMRSDWSNNYLFGNNPNIYPYLTISILLLFIRGFILSEKENNNEKSRFHHYHFQNLSYFSFLNSQTFWWFLSSTFCSLIYTAIGYYILKFNNEFYKYWLVFATIYLLGCITGILISNCCKKRSMVYFWLLLLVSFNIIFNGITISTKDYPKFLNSGNNAPVITDLSPVKWAFEAIVVDLAINNPYEKRLYPIEKKLEITMFNANYLIPAIQKKLINISHNIRKEENVKFLYAIQNEIRLLPQNNPEVFPFEFVENITPEKFNEQLLYDTNDYLTYMQIILSDQIRNSLEEKRRLEKTMIDSMGEKNYTKFKFANHNSFLYNLIDNSRINESVLFTNGILLKQLNPLFITPLSNFGRAHLFAPVKLFNKVYYNTFWFNIFALWLFIFAIYIATISFFFVAISDRK